MDTSTESYVHFMVYDSKKLQVRFSGRKRLMSRISEWLSSIVRKKSKNKVVCEKDSKKEILSSCSPCLDSQEQLLPARTVCDCVCLLPLLLDLSLW